MDAEDKKFNLNIVKDNLITKREELTHRLKSINKDFKTGHSSDSEEQVTERENDDVLLGVKQEAEIELSLVIEALQRLETGYYGICSECEKEINPARLKAVPYTTKCINCAINIGEQ